MGSKKIYILIGVPVFAVVFGYQFYLRYQTPMVQIIVGAALFVLWLIVFNVSMVNKAKKKIDIFENNPDLMQYFGTKKTMPQIIPDHLLKRLLYRYVPDEIRGSEPVITLGSGKKLSCPHGSLNSAGDIASAATVVGSAFEVAAFESELGSVCRIMLGSTIAMSEALNISNTKQCEKLYQYNGLLVKKTENQSELWTYSSAQNYDNMVSKNIFDSNNKSGFLVGLKKLSYDNIGSIVEEQLEIICQALNANFADLGWEYTPSSSRKSYFILGFGALGLLTAAAKTAASAANNAIYRSVNKSAFDYANIFVKFNEIVNIFNALL